MSVSMVDIAGFWLGIFLTFAILSFLYKDNPFYKFAEHLFIGVSVGYLVIRQVIDVLIPKLFTPIGAAETAFAYGLAVVPILLSVMMFFKLSKRWNWIGRYPVAFVVALFAGLQVNAVPNGDLVRQLGPATRSIVEHKISLNDAPADKLAQLPGVSPQVAEIIVEARKDKRFESVADVAQLEELNEAQRLALEQAEGPLQGIEARATVHSEPEIYWFGIFSNLLLLLGLVAGLIYFYFSLEHKGVLGRVSRFGVWVLMIGFGASFGFTVQGRLSLAIGRAMDVLGQDKPPSVADQIHGPYIALVSIAIIVVGIIMWERQAPSSSDEE